MYSTIVNTIRDICQTINSNGTFVHGSDLAASLKEIHKHGDYIFLPPFSSSFIPNNSSITTHNIVIVFARQDRHDSTPEQQEVIISEMEKLARLFVLALNETPYTIGEVSMTPVYRQNMVNKSGYRLQFTVTTHNNIC